MTLALLLLLVGAASAVGPQTGANDQRTAGVQPAQRTPAGALARPFETVPLEFQRPVLKSPFRPTYAPKLQGGAGQASAVPTRPQDRPAHMVCAIRIMKADPALDPGFVIRVPAQTMDPIARNPPCVAPQ